MTPAAAWALIKSHPRIALSVAVTLGCVGSFVAGRYSRPARVETRTEVVDHHATQIVYRDLERVRTVEGPVRVVEKTVTRWSDGETETTTTREEDRGPVTTDKTDDLTQDTKSSSDTHVETTSTVTAQPRWAVEGGARWNSLAVRPDEYRIGVGARVFGSLWLGLHATPAAHPNPEVTLRFEW